MDSICVGLFRGRPDIIKEAWKIYEGFGIESLRGRTLVPYGRLQHFISFPPSVLDDLDMDGLNDCFAFLEQKRVQANNIFDIVDPTFDGISEVIGFAGLAFAKNFSEEKFVIASGVEHVIITKIFYEWKNKTRTVIPALDYLMNNGIDIDRASILKWLDADYDRDRGFKYQHFDLSFDGFWMLLDFANRRLGPSFVAKEVSVTHLKELFNYIVEWKR